MPQPRPDLTGAPAALFVFSNLREQKGGLTRAWLRRLSAFHEAGWDTHIATIHPQPEIDETLAAWRARGWLPSATQVHHYQRRDKRFRPSWSRRTDETFTRDDRVADWLDWLVGRLPGVVVFADSPVTYAPVAMMRNPFVGRIMTVHLAHRKGGPKHARGAKRPKGGAGPDPELVTHSEAPPGTPAVPERSPEPPSAVGLGRRPRQIRSRYAGPVGQPRLSGRLLPFAPAADAVVALTGRQAADLRADVPGLEVHVIPNMIDHVPGNLVPSRDPLLVVQLGRLDSVKRVDHAMRAVAVASRSLPGLRLEVYGRGPELDHLLELRSDLGLQDVVSFPGFTDDPVEVLAGAAASLMTSRREGFGLAVAESLAAGTPVVTYDVDYGPAELVADGVNGRVVPDGSVEELAAALVEVLADPATWRSMSLAAPAAAERLRPELGGRAVARPRRGCGRTGRAAGVGPSRRGPTRAARGARGGGRQDLPLAGRAGRAARGRGPARTGGRGVGRGAVGRARAGSGRGRTRTCGGMGRRRRAGQGTGARRASPPATCRPLCRGGRSQPGPRVGSSRAEPPVAKASRCTARGCRSRSLRRSRDPSCSVGTRVTACCAG